MSGYYDRPPRSWLFNQHDLDEHQKTHWQCPIRLAQSVDGAPSVFAALWREAGTIRGGGAVASVLPVLALHTWIGKTFGGHDEPGWTSWQHLSCRRVARLSGTSTDAVTAVMRRLRDAKLLQSRTVPPPAHYGGPPRQEYRLASLLYRQGEEPFVTFTGELFYAGHWAVFPTPAMRALYLVLTCLTPIRNEEAYLKGRGLEPGDLDALDALWEKREQHPLSLNDLARASGMTRSTVAEALDALWTDVPVECEDGSRSPHIHRYIERQQASPPGMYCYMPGQLAWSWKWDLLNRQGNEQQNKPSGIATIRRHVWPDLAPARPQSPRKRKASRR